MQLFLWIFRKKCENAEISSKALDLRGMLDALRLIRKGLRAGAALDMGITNKAFDSYEQGAHPGRHRRQNPGKARPVPPVFRLI